MFNKIFGTGLLLGLSCSLFGGQVYSCGGGSACDGNLYAAWVVSQTANSYVLDVGIQVTNAYTGSIANSINDLAIIPDNQKPFSSASLTGTPSGGMWSFQNGATNFACDGAGAGYLCGVSRGTGSHLFTGSTPNLLVWQFTINGTPPSLGDTAKIKYRYVDMAGTQVGDSGSFNIAIQCIGAAGCDGGFNNADPLAAPEPVSSALVGTGLIGLYFVRRRLPGSRRNR